MKELLLKVGIVVWLVFSFLSCEKADPPKHWLPVDNKIQYDKATPSSKGFRNAEIEIAVEKLNRLEYVNSILILADGSLIAEQYFNHSGIHSAFNIKSVSKTILSALVGIAIKEGKIDGVEEKAISYFPEYADLNNDPRIRDLTLHHLMTMSSGLEFYENKTEGVLFSDNWIKNTLALPFLFDPGEKFLYGTDQSHLISAILTEATNQSTYAYANERIFNKTGIVVSQWDRDPQGYYFGGSEVYISTRSMLRFGELILNDGAYQGESLIPKEWVLNSTSNKFDSFAGSIGPFKINNYGYY